MFVLLILFSYCLTINSTGICHRRNLCRNKIESCHPVVMKCQNGSCRYRRFSPNDNQRLSFSRWFYDSNDQRCRRSNNQTEINFVHFRFLRDCRRLCSIIQRKKPDKIITLHISADTSNYNNTAHVHLYIDLSPSWIQKLASWMNISTLNYNSQAHYIQNYRRRFTNFVDAPYHLMLNRQKNNQ